MRYSILPPKIEFTEHVIRNPFPQAYEAVHHIALTLLQNVIHIIHCPTQQAVTNVAQDMHQVRDDAEFQQSTSLT